MASREVREVYMGIEADLAGRYERRTAAPKALAPLGDSAQREGGDVMAFLATRQLTAFYGDFQALFGNRLHAGSG